MLNYTPFIKKISFPFVSAIIAFWLLENLFILNHKREKEFVLHTVKLIQQKKTDVMFFVLIFYMDHGRIAPHSLYSMKQLFMKEHNTSERNISVSCMAAFFLFQEDFQLYCSSPKHSTLMAHISVHRALILQILDSFISQNSLCCVQPYEFAFFMASLLCHNSASIVCSLFFRPLHFLIFLKRKAGQHVR